MLECVIRLGIVWDIWFYLDVGNFMKYIVMKVFLERNRVKYLFLGIDYKIYDKIINFFFKE